MGDGEQPMTMKDSLGRLVPDVAAIRQLLSDAKVGREAPLNEPKSSKSSESLDEVVSILEKLDSKFKEDFERTKKYFESLVKTSKAELKESRNDDGCCEKLLDAIKSLGKVQEKAFDGFSADSQKMHRALSGFGGNGGNGGNGGSSSGGGSSGGGMGGGGIGGGGLGDIAKTKKGWAQFFQWAESTGAKMLGGFDALQHVMNGVVEKTIMFSNELKRTAWRVQGVTGDMTGLQAQWEASVSTWSELKELNGQSMQNNMAIYNKIRQKGIIREIKDLKTVNKLMQSAGLASTVLGSNAEATADLFGDWFVKLKLSEDQLGAIGRHMGRIGRETGVTGDAMIDVAKSSEGMLKNLKKYGNLTVSSTENVLNLMTRAKKTGHEQEMEEFLKPLQSTSDFLEAEGPMKNSHIRAAERVGRGQDLRDGTLLKSKEGMADLAKGHRMDIESFLPQGTTLDNFDELDPKLRGLIDKKVKDTTGLTLQQGKEMIEMIEESSESFSSKFDKLKSKKLAEKGDTESSLNLKKGYEKQLDDLTMSGRSSIMSGINEKAKKLSKIKGGGPVNADTIMSSMQKENGGKGNDTTKQINEMIAKGEIKGGATNAEKLKSVFMAQAEQLKEKGGVGTDGIDLTELASSMDVNNADALANVSEELQKAQDKIMAKEGNNTNAMDSLKDAIEKMNSWLATHLQPLLSAIPKEVLYLGAIASILPGVLGALMMAAGVWKNGLGMMKSLFTRGGGGGGGGGVRRVPRAPRAPRAPGGASRAGLAGRAGSAVGSATRGLGRGIASVGRGVGNVAADAGALANYAGGKVAGAGRWTGGKVADAGRWTGGKVADAGRWTGGKVADAGRWAVNSRAGQAVGWAGGKVAGAGRWTGGKVAGAGRWTGGKVADAGRWTGGKVADAGRWTGGKVADAGRWTGGKVADAGRWTGGKVADAGRWAVNSRAGQAVGNLGTRLGNVGRSVSTRVGNLGTRLGERASGLVTRVAESGLRKRVGGLVEGAGGLARKAVGNSKVVAGAGSLARKIGTAGLGATLKAVAGPITLAIGVFESLAQGVDASRAAGAIWNKSIEQLTAAEKNAAFTGGTLTGVLNFLTFGIFDEWIGSTGIVTKKLSELFKWIYDAMPWINTLMTGVRAVVTTVVDWIRKFFGGVWDGLKEGWAELTKSFEPLLANLQRLWGKVEGFFGWLGAKFESMFGRTFTSVLESCATWIGEVAAWLGKWAGYLSVSAITGWVGAFSLLVEGIIAGVEWVENLWTAISDLWKEADGNVLDFLYKGMRKSLTWAWEYFTTFVKGGKAAADMLDVSDGIEKVAAKTNEKVMEKAKAIKDPVAKAQELLRLRDLARMERAGAQKNLEYEKKNQAEIGGGFLDWYYGAIGTAASAVATTEATLSRADASVIEKEQELAVMSPDDIAKAEEANKALLKLEEAGTTPGSLYTHDVYCEVLLQNILGMMKGIANVSNEGMFAKDSVTDALFDGPELVANQQLVADLNRKLTGFGPEAVAELNRQLTGPESTANQQLARAEGLPVAAELNRQLIAAGMTPNTSATIQQGAIPGSIKSLPALPQAKLTDEESARVQEMERRLQPYKVRLAQFAQAQAMVKYPDALQSDPGFGEMQSGMLAGNLATPGGNWTSDNAHEFLGMPAGEQKDNGPSEALGAKLTRFVDSIGSLFGKDDLSGNMEAAFSAIVNTIIATSKPISDVHDRVREQNASNTAEVPRSASLARIDEISEKQLAQLVNINAGINQLIEFEKTKAKEQEAELVGYTAAQKKEEMIAQHNASTPDYGGWSQALSPRGLGNNQVISDGVVT